MVIHPYYSSSGSNLVLEYIESLQPDEQADAYTVLRRMAEGRFEEITVKPWERKIYEVYFFKHNRIFYVAADGNNIYLLHACQKQKNKTERKDAAIVRKRAKEVGLKVGKIFI